MIITHNPAIIITRGTHMHDISTKFAMMIELVETCVISSAQGDENACKVPTHRYLISKYF
jgi:hypothetical protein